MDQINKNRIISEMSKEKKKLLDVVSLIGALNGIGLNLTQNLVSDEIRDGVLPLIEKAREFLSEQYWKYIETK